MATLIEWIKLLAAIAVLILLGEVSAVRGFAAAIDAQRSWALPLTIGITVVGFLVLVWGMARIARQEGRPMSREEYEELSARTQIQGPGRIASKAGFRGVHKGVVLPQTEWTFQHLKAAWRSGSWWTDPDVRSRFLATSGGVVLALGLFSVFVVMMPLPAMKVVLLGTVAYAAVRLVLAFRRA